MSRIPLLVLIDFIILGLFLAGMIWIDLRHRLPPRQDRPVGYYERGKDS